MSLAVTAPFTPIPPVINTFMIACPYDRHLSFYPV